MCTSFIVHILYYLFIQCSGYYPIFHTDGVPGLGLTVTATL